MSNMQIPHGLEKWLGALLLKINFSNFLETDYFSAEQTMERLCQGTAFPEHPSGPLNFWGRSEK